jgi:hypothetical protein
VVVEKTAAGVMVKEVEEGDRRMELGIGGEDVSGGITGDSLKHAGDVKK